MKLTPRCSGSIGNVMMSMALLLVVGCGGKPAKVSGTVSIDGAPVQQGTVTFAPTGGGMRATGIIQSDGSYRIQTNRDVGLEIGEYDVAVASREIISTGEGSPPRPGKFFVPSRYGRTTTSGLHYSVEKGSNVIDIDLSSEGLAEDNKPRRRR